MSGVEILLSDRNGIYIPSLFVEDFDGWGVSEQDKNDLSNVENDYYWETWDDVLNYASHTDSKGNVWRLYQDGDLFAICDELMSDEDYKNFFGEERQ